VSSADGAIGLDVHLEFCEVAVCENGQVRCIGRVDTKPEALEALAASLLATDRAALEVMGASWRSSGILEPHVAQVIVVSPGDTGSPTRGRGPIGLTRGRWRGCCGSVSLRECGRRMSTRAGACRVASSWCGRDRGASTRSMRC
jgi:hypothetical protein